MASEPQSHTTVAEYLHRERAEPERHEYLDGEVFAMGGASRRHNRIAVNLVVALEPQATAHGCELFVADMRLRVETSGLFTYPDLAVVCGEPQFADAELDTLLNPTLLIESLAPSTEAYDRGRKAAHYRPIPSLAEYLLVSQGEPRIERYSRDGGTWRLAETTDLGATLEVPSAGATLPVAAVYRGVFGR